MLMPVLLTLASLGMPPDSLSHVGVNLHVVLFN